MIFPLIVLIIWLVIGVLTLCSKKIDKVDYAVVWSLLIMYLLIDVLEAMGGN